MKGREKMKKKFSIRFLSAAAAGVLTAGMLSVGALAADCAHLNMEAGYCFDCKTQYATIVDGTYYRTVAEGIQAAAHGEDKGVDLLCDLGGQNLDLGDVYLVIDENPVVIEHSTLKGTSPNGVLVNKGELTLVDSAVSNTKGEFALMNEGGVLQLSNAVLEAETLQVKMEGGMVKLATKPVGGKLLVENRIPGTFATVVGSVVPGAEEGWIENAGGTTAYDDTEKSWSMAGDISHAVTIGEEALVYNGEVQYPAVSITLHGRQLVAGKDYILYCPVDAPKAPVAEVSDGEGGEPAEAEEKIAVIDPVAAGKYYLCMEAVAPYSGSFETEFTIEKAQAEIKWNADSDAVTYTAAPAVPTAKAEVTTVDGAACDGAITYSYRAAGTQDAFAEGLPTNAGKYEVKAHVAAFTNHLGGETAAPMVLTIAPKQITPKAEVKTEGEGFRYNGSSHTPKVVLTDGETVIPEGEYTLSYRDNVNAGSGKVIVSAANRNYTFADVEASFPIAKAVRTDLRIENAPEALTYGADSFKLTVNVEKDSSAAWSVTEGSSCASITDKGVVTVLGAGKFTVEALVHTDDNHEDTKLTWSCEVAPAPLEITGVTAENKNFDGTKTVAVTKVQLKGVVNRDDVKILTDELKGEVADSKAGTYNSVKLIDPKLTGENAKHYRLVLPEEGVKTTVQIKKADLTTALESIAVSLPVSTENVVVENLGGGMPKDAGKLTFTNRNQSTAKGTKAIVLKWGADENGKLTAQIVNAAGGDRITFEVAVASENYNTALVEVVVSMGAQAVDSSKLTIAAVGEALTYNGSEQKPNFTVKYDGTALTAGTDYDITYPADCKSAGEKEVTVAFKGAYQGTAKAKYAIGKAKLSVSGTAVTDKTYNGNATANIVVGTVSGAVKGDDVKVTASGTFSDSNSGTRTVNVSYKLQGNAAANYVLAKDSETISGKIVPVTTGQLNAGINGLTTANVTSANSYALQTAINQANTALGDRGLSEAQKTNINNVKWNAETMLARVNNAAAAAATDSIKATEKLTVETVTLKDKDALQTARGDLNTALKNYEGNYTPAEKQKLKDTQTAVDKAFTVISRVESTTALISALPDDTAAVDAMAMDSIRDARASYDKLTDYEKSLVEEELMQKLTAVELAAGVEQKPENTPQQNITGRDPAEGEENRDTISLPMWIFWIAVLMASSVALVFVWMKIKDNNKKNW